MMQLKYQLQPKSVIQTTVSLFNCHFTFQKQFPTHFPQKQLPYLTYRFQLQCNLTLHFSKADCLASDPGRYPFLVCGKNRITRDRGGWITTTYNARLPSKFDFHPHPPTHWRISGWLIAQWVRGRAPGYVDLGCDFKVLMLGIVVLEWWQIILFLSDYRFLLVGSISYVNVVTLKEIQYLNY